MTQIKLDPKYDGQKKINENLATGNSCFEVFLVLYKPI